MRARAAVRIGVLVAALALVAGACGDGKDTRECHTCHVDENCDHDQECVPAVDDHLRCFDVGEATCRLDPVDVARKPTPTPIATP